MLIRNHRISRNVLCYQEVSDVKNLNGNGKKESIQVKLNYFHLAIEKKDKFKQPTIIHKVL